MRKYFAGMAAALVVASLLAQAPAGDASKAKANSSKLGMPRSIVI